MQWRAKARRVKREAGANALASRFCLQPVICLVAAHATLPSAGAIPLYADTTRRSVLAALCRARFRFPPASLDILPAAVCTVLASAWPPHPNSPETALPWPETRVVSSAKPPQRGFCASGCVLAGGSSGKHLPRKPLTCGFSHRRRERPPRAARARTHNPRFWPRKLASAEAGGFVELTTRVSGHASPLDTASSRRPGPAWLSANHAVRPPERYTLLVETSGP